jgi:hypothetical protein
LVHSKPIFGDLPIKITVSYCGAFQLRPQGFGAAALHVMLYRRFDKLAAEPFLSEPVNGLDRGRGQDDVDAFSHGIEI